MKTTTILRAYEKAANRYGYWWSIWLYRKDSGSYEYAKATRYGKLSHKLMIWLVNRIFDLEETERWYKDSNR